MGATFPILVASRPRDRSGTGVALLYGANTAAAAIGALAGSFLLLPLVGTIRTFAAAALLNAAAAALAFVAARRAADSPPRQEQDARESAASVRALRAGMLAALSGAIGATLQFGWSRAMTFAFGSSVYALGLTLAACLLGLGLGPLLFAARGAADHGRAQRGAAGAAWTVGATSLVVLPLLGTLPRLAPVLSLLFERSPVAALLAQFAVAFLLLLLPAMAQGACLPLLVACASDRSGTGRAAGGVYAASTLGSALGFLVAGFLLVPRVGTRTTLALAGAAALMLCLLLQPRLRALPVLATAAALALIALPAWDHDLISGGGFLYGPVYRAALADRPLTEAVRARGEILFEREDGDGLVTVRRARSGILSLQINGRTEASTGADMATQILAAHLPLLLHAAPRDVLVVGLASGVTVGAAERHAVGSVRVLEIARAVPAAAALFSQANGQALDDPRLDLVIDDARARLLSRDDQYDVVISQPSNPWVAGVANLFTEDFYRLVRRRLRDGGIFCQWIQAYRIEPSDLGGIVRSFLEVFPEATLWEESAGGGDYFLVAGTAPLRIDPEGIEGAAPAVREDLRRAGVSGGADLLARFVAGPPGLLGLADGARRHTDDNLYLEWRAPLALFTDTLRLQVSALQGYREPVLAYLPARAVADPAFVAELRHRLRSREARLLIADSQQQTDLLALREPHLAAGLEALRPDNSPRRPRP
jgi:spermidine synthase